MRTGRILYLPAWECVPVAHDSSLCGRRAESAREQAAEHMNERVQSLTEGRLTARASASGPRSDGCTACTETP